MGLPNVKLYAEIPFQDGPEAAYVETVTRKTGIISNEDWEAQRKYMLMIHIDDWAEIKKALLKMCRINQEKCKNKVESIDESVRKLDKVIRGVFG